MTRATVLRLRSRHELLLILFDERVGANTPVVTIEVRDNDSVVLVLQSEMSVEVVGLTPELELENAAWQLLLPADVQSTYKVDEPVRPA